MNASENGISVLIADDHDLLAEMLETFLKSAGFKNTARAKSLHEALEKISNTGSFDIVLLDWDMPGMDGILGIEKAVAANKNGAVVIFSGYARQEVIFRALEVGARGFIPKTVTAKSMTNALRFIATGEVYLPSFIAESMALSKKLSRQSPLTAKEMEVVRGICRGDTNKDIARNLGLKEVQVKRYLQTISAKLNVSNRTQIAMAALSQGLLSGI